MSFLFCLDDIGWDWVSQKLYWTDPCGSDIEVYDPATTYRRVLYSSTDGLRNPAGLVVDPGNGYIYPTCSERLKIIC